MTTPRKVKKSGNCCVDTTKTLFCYGQIKTKKSEDKSPPPPGKSWFYKKFIHERPQWVSYILPFIIVWTGWLIVVSSRNLWYVFGEVGEEPVYGNSTVLLSNGTEIYNDTIIGYENGVYGYKMTITMFFGSMIAGATSEGGASIAFPVMTLVLDIDSKTARDFSLMIQSFGMTAASFTIWYNRLKVEQNSVTFATIGGVFGIVIGLKWISPALPDDYSKMVFVSVWIAFALNLLYLNLRHRGRHTFLTIPNPTPWKKACLFFIGIVGGILSSISGSGIDIASFAVLTLFFRVSEKTATPTSVLLMAINTVVGFFVQGALLDDIDQRTYELWCAAIPIVVVGAPLGAMISSFLHRQVLASFVYITDITQFILACIIVDMTVALIVTTASVTVFALAFFATLTYLGSILLRKSLDFVAAQNVTGVLPATIQTDLGAKDDFVKGKDIELVGMDAVVSDEKEGGSKASDTPSPDATGGGVKGKDDNVTPLEVKKDVSTDEDEDSSSSGISNSLGVSDPKFPIANIDGVSNETEKSSISSTESSSEESS